MKKVNLTLVKMTVTMIMSLLLIISTYTVLISFGVDNNIAMAVAGTLAWAVALAGAFFGALAWALAGVKEFSFLKVFFFLFSFMAMITVGFYLIFTLQYYTGGIVISIGMIVALSFVILDYIVQVNGEKSWFGKKVAIA